jgi:hypothetical protein
MNYSVPAIHCDKMAVNDMSFCQHAVTESLVKENNSAADIHAGFHHVYRDAGMSVRR